MVCEMRKIEDYKIIATATLEFLERAVKNSVNHEGYQILGSPFFGDYCGSNFFQAVVKYEEVKDD